MKVAIIGAGNSGLAMAAHLRFMGHRIRLWNRSEEPVSELKKTGKITTSGVLVGDFDLDLVTTNMADVLKWSKIILVTTPATSHGDLARLMAPFLGKDHIVILNPGRTFGAVDFKDELVRMGNEENVSILETQTIIYTCRKLSQTSVNILALKRDVLISSFEGVNLTEILQRIPDELNKFYKPAKSMVETSIGNVGMVLHCAPMVLNAGWVESGHDFKYYREGISPTITAFIEELDRERQAVAAALNHPVVSVLEWMNISYGLQEDTLYGCIQKNPSYETIVAPRTLSYRYLLEDVPYGLVPLESMGKDLGLPMTHTRAIIDLANLLLKTDFRASGRTAEKLHFDYKDLMKGVRVEDILLT